MKSVYSKTAFPKAPGGNIYEWTVVETKFTAPTDGHFVIAVTATAKSANQNNSTDDDDLRVQLDGYDFGRYENFHAEKAVSRNFGTSASFDGATLKGGTQTIYFFVRLTAGEHTLKFFADETPSLQRLEVFELVADETFEFERLRQKPEIQTAERGVPFVSFIFLGVKPKLFGISATCQSGQQKKTTDGDNLKVVVNGKIRQNEQASTSDKYKNFYFSGDLNRGEIKTLILSSTDFEFFEDSVELWYDESPSCFVGVEVFDDVEGWWNEIGEEMKSAYHGSWIIAIIGALKINGLAYSAQFLQHAWNDNPTNLNFDSQSAIAQLVKNDHSYAKLIALLRQEIEKGALQGEIILGGSLDSSVAFENGDLSLAIHGIKKIEFVVVAQNDGAYKINFDLFDVYDFSEMEYRLSTYASWYKICANNRANDAETAGVVNNFEIKISLTDEITL